MRDAVPDAQEGLYTSLRVVRIQLGAITTIGRGASAWRAAKHLIMAASAPPTSTR